MWIAAMISRRSWAIGWRRAIIEMAASSTCRCSLSMRWSAAMMRCARAPSWVDQRDHRIGDLLLGEPAHLGDLLGEVAELVVIGADGMIGHGLSFPAGCLSLIRSGP